MKEVLSEAKKDFETEHPKTSIAFNFSGSQVLRLQIEQGAPADIFISANSEHMQALKEAGHVQQERLLAHNELVIITPANNQSQVSQLTDLSKAHRIVIGTSQSPIGKYTRQVLHQATKEWGDNFENAVFKKVVSQETNVRLIRAKIALGEADAALVYRTDTVNSSKIRSIAIPTDLNIKAAYMMAMTTSTSQESLSHAFLNYFKTPKGLALLTRHGFVVN